MLFPYSFWQNPPASTLKGNLISYYNFRTFTQSGNKVADVANNSNPANRHDLTPTGTMLFGPGKVQVNSHPPQIDLSFYCSGYNILQNNSNVFDLNSDKTISFWFNTRDVPPDGFIEGFLLSNTSDYNTNGYYFLNSTDNLQVSIFTTGGLDISHNYFNAVTGQWHLIILSVDYKNGISRTLLDNSIAITGVWGQNDKPFPSSGQFTVGTPLLGVGSVNSYVDELSIWSRQLTDVEKTYLWNNGNGRTYPFYFQ